MTSLRHVLLLQRNVATAARFYSEGLGLKLEVLTERWAELKAGQTTLALKAVEGEAFLSVGYSPILSFKVDDLQDTLMKLIELGGVMDGPIKYPTQGKVASLRAPDGHMIALHEPN
ncbi:hypothetical protein BSKO_11751 [Bryopsis sp. KO-2023]|nr:hypothetical protein BSKO_11751 [Bryopsis sp. KO-2023]